MNKKTFKYLRPKSPSEACNLKDKYGEKAKFWAGGTDLLLQWQEEKNSLDYCIDLTFIPELEYIKKSTDKISFGSLTKVSTIEESLNINNSLSIIQNSAGELGPPGIRTTATIGGNICHAAPSADLATPLIVLGAEAKILSSNGERRIKMDQFFHHVNHTDLKEDELLTEINVPLPPAETATCFLKVGRTVIDIAIVNMSARATMDEAGIITDIRIAFGAVAPTPIRLPKAEEMLIGSNVSKINENLITEISELAAKEVKPITDVRGTEEYRREISKVLTKRALENIIEDLRNRRKA